MSIKRFFKGLDSVLWLKCHILRNAKCLNAGWQGDKDGNYEHSVICLQNLFGNGAVYIKYDKSDVRVEGNAKNWQITEEVLDSSIHR